MGLNWVKFLVVKYCLIFWINPLNSRSQLKIRPVSCTTPREMELVFSTKVTPYPYRGCLLGAGFVGNTAHPSLAEQDSGSARAERLIERLGFVGAPRAHNR